MHDSAMGQDGKFQHIVLIVLVALCCVTVDEILEHYAVFNSIIHNEIVLLIIK